jgi:hypothetical protein
MWHPRFVPLCPDPLSIALTNTLIFRYKKVFVMGVQKTLFEAIGKLQVLAGRHVTTLSVPEGQGFRRISTGKYP